MPSYYSHGKLLISCEYAVLDGAKALALPTKLGQQSFKNIQIIFIEKFRLSK